MGNRNNININNNVTKSELRKLIRKAIKNGSIPKHQLSNALRTMGYIVKNNNNTNIKYNKK